MSIRQLKPNEKDRRKKQGEEGNKEPVVSQIIIGTADLTLQMILLE